MAEEAAIDLTIKTGEAETNVQKLKKELQKLKTEIKQSIGRPLSIEGEELSTIYFKLTFKYKKFVFCNKTETIPTLFFSPTLKTETFLKTSSP